MCEECNQNRGAIFQSGIETGLSHIDQLDTYYPGLNQYGVEFDPLKKAVVISPQKVRYGEESFDAYIQELLEELSDGLRLGDKREHIKNVLLKFSDRKFKDKNWWGNLTEKEIEELLVGVRSYYLPHTAMLNSGLSEAYIFGKFSKVLTESMSLKKARATVKGLELTAFDKARIDAIQKTAHIFWNKAISREVDSATIKLLQYNRDVTTEILKDPNRKNWRSLTSDIYHSINKDKSIILRDLDRITRTETAYSQNYAILSAGKDSGAKYFFVQVRPTACKICKGMYLDKNGKPKRFLIEDVMDLPRDLNWGKKPKDFKLVHPPVHPWCFCVLFYE